MSQSVLPHRRLMVSSDTSQSTVISESLEAAINDNLRLERLLEEAMPDPTTGLIRPSELGRMLSMKSVVSTSSSFAARQQEASNPPSKSLDKIGAGTCGTILTRPGTNTVLKLAKHNTTALTGDLFNDFKWHLRVYNAMQHSKLNDCPKVPFLQAWIGASKEDWWNANNDISEAANANMIAAPCDIISSERIVPLPRPIRNLLIDKYCPVPLRDRAREEAANKDCLVRVYLGANKVPDGPRKMFFSLRNYKLHLNQMVELGMEVNTFAKSMASALAVMHWKVGIDAKDVEFVVGSSPQPKFPQLQHMEDEIITAAEQGYVGPETTSHLNWYKRETEFWLLDFNLCSEITMDDAGVEMAAKAWSINDPYYPRPLQENNMNKGLWNVFVRRYIEVSDRILGEDKPELVELPRKFIQRIIEIQREKMAQKGRADL